MHEEKLASSDQTPQIVNLEAVNNSGETVVIAHTGGALSLLLVFLLGDQITKWWQWAQLDLPLLYDFNVLTDNEMLSSGWRNKPEMRVTEGRLQLLQDIRDI
ncbi:ABC transporter-like [Abeliophyllum distichum]|uniref:ABC transporter-like n=1 Tax=Abeliophyllum distichum TaxID=126358 RepID=A0ABD1VZH6_9LAMI